MLILGLAALVGSTYSGLGQNGFIDFDDDKYVSENPVVGRGLTWAGLGWAFSSVGYAHNWHPLTWLSHMLDVQLFGLDPGAHHLVNLALHTANASLLFVVLRSMTGALWRSALTAAVFGVHPLHVESVAWIAERKDVLSTLFWMTTVWSAVSFARRPRPAVYAVAIVSYSLGLLAKPMLVTLPFLLLLLDYWPLGRLAAGGRRAGGRTLPTGGRLVAEKLPFFALAAFSGAMTWWAQSPGTLVIPLRDLPFSQRLANASSSYVAYIWDALWPTRLAIFYPHARGDLSVAAAIAGFLMLAIASFLVFRFGRRQPYLRTGWLWYLGTLVPVIGLVQTGGQARADRYTYVPLIGLTVMAAWGLQAGLDRRPAARRAAIAACALCLAALSWVAHRQVGVWRDNYTLYSHAVQATRGNWLAHNNLAVALEESGLVGPAIAHYQEALRIDPRYGAAHNNLGVLLLGLGNTAGALHHLAEAARLYPDEPKVAFNLGTALKRTGRNVEAGRWWRRSLSLNPDNPEARKALESLPAP